MYEQHLFGAWRAAGLDAAPRSDGGITFGCPKCAKCRLEVTEGLVACPECSWGAEGEAWDVAAEAKKIVKAPATDGGLPPIMFGHEIAAKEIVLPDELIVGMLHRGAKMVLGGGSKSFKTWCLADLGLSIATGRRWWGREVRQGRVAYLNLEVQGEFFSVRLQDIAHAKGVSLPAALGVWNLRGHCSDHRILLPELSKRLHGEEWAAIILDPTYKVMAGSENAQEEVAALMDSIEKLAAATGAAVIFGSHFAKGNAAGKDAIDRISGSGVFARDPDAILTMTRHEEENVFVIDPILRNCPPVAPFCVRWEFPLMRAAPEFDVKALAQPGKGPRKPAPTAAQVCRVIEDAGGNVPGGLNSEQGLVRRLQHEYAVSRDAAKEAVQGALFTGAIDLIQAPGEQPRGGGSPKRIYVLKPIEPRKKS